LYLELGHRELDQYHIDLEAILARIVLQDARDEGLGEVEARYPINHRFAVVYPLLEEGQPENGDELSYFSIY